ncbi:unnamed protein product [Urochloa humidicola]
MAGHGNKKNICLCPRGGDRTGVDFFFFRPGFSSPPGVPVSVPFRFRLRFGTHQSSIAAPRIELQRNYQESCKMYCLIVPLAIASREESRQRSGSSAVLVEQLFKILAC